VRPLSFISLLSFISILAAACASAPAGLSRPNGVAPLPDGNVAVMDFGNYRVARISPEGKLIGSFGSLGVESDQIFFGWDMAVDAAGNIYICNQVAADADTTHDGVKVFSPDGKLLREIGATDYAPGAETIYTPYALDIDSLGRVYTADFGTSTVRAFDSQGRLLAELFGEVGSGPGAFESLSDVAVDDSRGLLYVSDNLNSQIQQFALAFRDGGVTASHVETFGTYGRGPGQFAYPQNLAVDDSTGYLYVGDVANRRIQIFDANGDYVSEIDLPTGVTDWQVMGLNVGGDGALYVADALNAAVWVFERDGRLRRKIEVGT
jgi:DNA-binding beta-propeller fold protein YncE